MKIGFEKLPDWLNDLWMSIRPTDFVSWGVWIFMIMTVIIALAVRKQHGFWKAITSMWLPVIIGVILYQVSPWILVGMLVVNLCYTFIFAKHQKAFRRVMLAIVIVGAIALAYYNAFLM